ncbi:MAG: hypothetical protein JW795_16585 [Chitinivibrionales bacterium]|nr:hypothetical protein [Chitinivibrionales bacterium]
MFKKFLMIALVGVVMVLGLFTNSVAQAAAEKIDTLVVTARLIEIPTKFAPNDLYNYVYIMKYRILTVVKGTYKEKEILVGHYNPLIPRKNIKDNMKQYTIGNVEKFETGAVQKLVLVSPFDKIWADAIDDNYFDSPLKKYFAIQADVSK